MQAFGFRGLGFGVLGAFTLACPADDSGYNTYSPTTTLRLLLSRSKLSEHAKLSSTSPKRQPHREAKLVKQGSLTGEPNIVVSIIGIGFWCILYQKYNNRNPPKTLF